jgi:hypothetical protein
MHLKAVSFQTPRPSFSFYFPFIYISFSHREVHRKRQILHNLQLLE